jgi:predicted enzyme related to lactoylglutathione lyase
MARVVHFEIHADEVERAKAFYSALFGWQFDEVMPGLYWLITTGPDSEPGINGGLMQRQQGQSGDIVMAYVCTIEVEDIDATLTKAEKLGATIAMPRHAIPGVGWQAYARDSEGNVFGLHQRDEKAA